MELAGYIYDDHEVIRKFIQEIESAENVKIKNKIFTEMLPFLHAYFQAIETALYSKSLSSNIYELNELALDGYEEHHLIEDLVYRIRNSKKDEVLWLSRINDFCQILDLHLSAEEVDYYAEIKNYFTPVELDRAAVIYLKAKKSELIAAEQEQQKPSLELSRENKLN